MNISHDGERWFRVADDLTAEPFTRRVSDAYLRGLIADLESDDPARVERAQLHRQPGAYRCSTPEIDALVDIACRTPGVLGAQIAGAGLGGCAMVLAEEEAVPASRGWTSSTAAGPALGGLRLHPRRRQPCRRHRILRGH